MVKLFFLRVYSWCNILQFKEKADDNIFHFVFLKVGFVLSFDEITDNLDILFADDSTLFT